ncbi:taurine ABC transporter ATP-binding protein [Kaistia dalseonensis]|uniref:Taurine transport system ATP-binding protein n=1 Tax=Kaistia dalseonensis TaxID=410840 RepID=A0ABU0H6D8_9HYPH|nr:taurine ABC transporter ATP-binding protein [Kaistia dalseonensis]MCX5495285.1 taurine ABC transporter ATP-binding protein [Kaistia dalseonensis]MDQ0437871.1 taurine transport system ATP-binding protein [Kaistia dalseonensis]
MPHLTLDSISLSYDGGAPVLANVSLGLRSGEFVVVVGRSGCGKTSLLNLAAGFVTPTSGRVLVDDAAVKGPGADRAVVFQDDALFPWLSTAENVAFGPRLAGIGAAERRRIADERLAIVGLPGLGDRPIWRLSGGQRQRVGLARALAANPTFLLMDEPLGALDAMTREAMQELLLDVWGRTQAGFLLITHGVEEALFLATRIVVMAPGPGRIVRTLAVDFGKRRLAGESARAIKASADFVAARESLLDAIFEREAA